MKKNVSVDELKKLYVEKCAILEGLYEEVSPYDFYREMYPEGFLQASLKESPESAHDGKMTAIANVVIPCRDGRERRRNQQITDNLKGIHSLKHRVSYMPACSFLGKHKTLSNLRFIHAFVVDLDGVETLHLNNVIHQINIGYIPRPTYIVNSGTGLHLYFMLTSPIKVYPGQIEGYKALKKALIYHCWNSDTSYDEKIQYSGVVQPYRVIGSRSKLDCPSGSSVPKTDDYPVLAWKTGEKVTLDYLFNFTPSLPLGRYEKDMKEAYALLHPEESSDHLTLKDAKEKYPDWYERRIELGLPRKDIKDYRWHINPRVYEWWLRRIREEAQQGHRYHCIMCLAIYAIKCDIPYGKLKKDAYGLLEIFESRTTDESNHFVETDIKQALAVFNHKRYAAFTLKQIEYFSGLHVSRNRRNGRTQQKHLIGARAVQAAWDPDGEWRNKEGRPKGSGTKRDLILNYKKEHPEANHSEIARVLGVSRPTVIKWLKEEYSSN